MTKYVYEYDIWNGVKSVRPVEYSTSLNVEAPKKKGSKKEAPISDKEKE